MKIMLAVLVVSGAAAFAGVAQPRLARSAEPPSASPQSITVTGNGSVAGVPDRATFSFTVTSVADTAKDALAKNETDADAVVAALKGANVQTSGLTLDQRTDANGNPIPGYTATTTVTADADLADAGSLIDAAVAAGATSFSGPSFSLSDQDTLYRAALKAAVADAKDKATALADAAGVTLGAVQTISEGQQVTTPLPFGPAAGAAKIVPGTQTVDATVTVTYALS